MRERGGGVDGSEMSRAFHVQRGEQFPAEIGVFGRRDEGNRRGGQRFSPVFRVQSREEDQAEVQADGGERNSSSSSGDAQNHRSGIRDSS